MTDEFRSLVERCCRGDQRAIRALVDRYQQQVFGLCLRMLRNSHDAEDVAQETFLRAVRSLDRWDPDREFLPWLMTIAANRCRTALAARPKRGTTLDEPEQLVDRSADPHAAGQLSEEVGQALGQMRDEYRQALLLFHQADLSYVEIAQALDVPVGTVRTWVHRGRRELADRLRRRQAIEEYPSALRRV
ncbi:MAG: sigma-70 family RNA polymerase sigma factor [Planctomycetes bacterium]|nr:sigma-70 family RNA polymerase sigma factor [Planctomycetota bacterium]